MKRYEMIIDSQGVADQSYFEVINPATLEVIAEVPECGVDNLDRALNSAAFAFKTWQKDEGLRVECLKKASQKLFESASFLGKILTTEQGKPLSDATAEILGCGLWFKYYSELEIPREIIQDDDRAFVEVIRKPIGVTAAITPWNFPAILAAWKIAPALRAGNTLVIKPSPFTPITTVEIVKLLSEVFPPGVINVVTGGDALGKALVSHQQVRKVSFTGSIEAGRSVGVTAAGDFKRVTLELGGNDPAIVLQDADINEVSESLFWGAFSNNGQICSAIKRLYVHTSKYEQLVESLATYAKGVKVGNGLDPDVRLGPVNNKPQYERVKTLVEDAKSNGANFVTGGSPLEGPGYFFEPTIVTGIDSGTRLVDEEQFGPVLPVIPFENLDDVIEKANATSFGLSGSVWSKDPDRAREIATRLDCGTSWVNCHIALAPYQPFGGHKESGLGVENGPWGYYGFTDIQVSHQKRR
jgi:acyl-CoA reductase-like NAD-dependent aldehyde dehydrogenase